MELVNTTEGVTVTLHGFLVADPDDNLYTDKQNSIDLTHYNPVLWIVATKADRKTMLYASDSYAEEHYALTKLTAQQTAQQISFTDAFHQLAPMYKILQNDEKTASKAGLGVNRAATGSLWEAACKAADCSVVKVPPSNAGEKARVPPIDAGEKVSDHLIKEGEDLKDIKEQQRLLSKEKDTLQRQKAELTAQKALADINSAKKVLKDATDQKNAVAAAVAAEARSDKLVAERIAEKMQHEAKIQELENLAAIRSAELAQLAEAKERALEAKREALEEALGKQRDELEQSLAKQRDELQQQREAMDKEREEKEREQKEREEQAQQMPQPPPQEDRAVPSPSLSQSAGSARRASANDAEVRLIPYGGGSRQRSSRPISGRRSRSRSRSRSRRRQSIRSRSRSRRRRSTRSRSRSRSRVDQIQIKRNRSRSRSPAARSHSPDPQRYDEYLQRQQMQQTQFRLMQQQ